MMNVAGFCIISMSALVLNMQHNLYLMPLKLVLTVLCGVECVGDFQVRVCTLYKFLRMTRYCMIVTRT